MNSPEKFEIQEGENCPICGGTGPCGDPECKHGQAYEAEQLRKMEESIESKKLTEEPISETTPDTSVVHVDQDYDAREEAGYPKSNSLRRNR